MGYNRAVLTVLSLLSVILGVMQCPSMRDHGVEPRLACYLDQTPACPEDRPHCIGLHVHVAPGAQDPAWLAAGLEHARWLFEPAELAFQVVAVDSLGPEFTQVRTRYQRDIIGRKRYGEGVVHVFMVERLDDVDVADAQIRGVHWRQRSNPDKRWVILSSKGSQVVLGHELGHFFGLPHSRYPLSVMNKKPRETPSWPERVFVPEELDIIVPKRDEMLRTGELESSEVAERSYSP